MKVKEESEKVGFKLNIQKTKIMTSGPIILWQIDEEKMETGTGLAALAAQAQIVGPPPGRRHGHI